MRYQTGKVQNQACTIIRLHHRHALGIAGAEIVITLIQATADTGKIESDTGRVLNGVTRGLRRLSVKTQHDFRAVSRHRRKVDILKCQGADARRCQCQRTDHQQFLDLFQHYVPQAVLLVPFSDLHDSTPAHFCTSDSVRGRLTQPPLPSPTISRSWMRDSVTRSTRP